jgi:hypothetical protein
LPGPTASRASEEFRRKLIRWKSRNSQGRLARKLGPSVLGNYTSPPWFIIQQVEIYDRFGFLTRSNLQFGLDCNLAFKVIERPPVGSVRIYQCAEPGAYLLHIADDREAGEAWRREFRPDAVLEEVTADEVAADHVEGRVVTWRR